MATQRAAGACLHACETVSAFFCLLLQEQNAVVEIETSIRFPRVCQAVQSKYCFRSEHHRIAPRMVRVEHCLPLVGHDATTDPLFFEVQASAV